jgi:hypothetical protein
VQVRFVITLCINQQQLICVVYEVIREQNIVYTPG